MMGARAIAPWVIMNQLFLKSEIAGVELPFQ